MYINHDSLLLLLLLLSFYYILDSNVFVRKLTCCYDKKEICLLISLL